MTDRSRILAAAGALVLSPLALVGCSSASQQDFDQAVPAAVVAADPNIVDTYLSYSTGLAGIGFWLRIYVSDTSDDAVAGAVDAAFAAAFHASPAPPTSIVLDVAEAPKPASVNARTGQLSLDGVAAQLGLAADTSDDRITLSSGELAERYGAWQARG